MQVQALDPMDPGEQAPVVFDFGLILLEGETLLNPQINIGVSSGADEAPATRLIGAATIVASPATQQANGAVQQVVGQLVPGTCYWLQALATSSLTNSKIVSTWTRIRCDQLI